MTSVVSESEWSSASELWLLIVTTAGNGVAVPQRFEAVDEMEMSATFTFDASK